MCGIVGYVGRREAAPLLIDGLKRLEYRGYDSAGLATITGRRLHLRKRAGRVAHLADLLDREPAPGEVGIAHTRWATHGAANDRNSHPHIVDEVALVHNGVIENHAALKRQLNDDGIQFTSDTDTEVIAQLIARHLQDDLVDAVQEVLPMLKGSYGLAVMTARNPDLLVGARLGSPLVLGIGDGEYFLASDPSALAGLTDRIVFLQDGQIVVASTVGWQVLDGGRESATVSIQTVEPTDMESDLGDFPHYMLKEIYEQPDSIARALNTRQPCIKYGRRATDIVLPGVSCMLPHALQRAGRLILTACGTSYHAAMVGEYLFEEFARLPVEVEYASEFRYRNAPLDRDTAVMAITQSGETADTLAALRESKRRGQPALAICNVAGSSIAREADASVLLHAGPEIGVASTKAFTSQVTVLTALALHLGRMRHLTPVQGTRMIDELQSLPDAVRSALDCHDQVRDIACRYAESTNMLYLGRQYLYPVALEGALKLKEISYIHAEGYPAAEMKHGPIALVDADTPSVFLISGGPIFEKVMSNLEEVRARGGPVIAVVGDRDPEIVAQVEQCSDETIVIPDVPEHLQPIVFAIPMQLMAYHIARERGCDVDKPRNLAKSVTVE